MRRMKVLQREGTHQGIQRFKYVLELFTAYLEKKIQNTEG
jgi:hypothetical protein